MDKQNGRLKAVKERSVCATNIQTYITRYQKDEFDLWRKFFQFSTKIILLHSRDITILLLPCVVNYATTVQSVRTTLQQSCKTC